MNIPKVQTAAVVRELGGAVEFVTDYPVPQLRHNEVLARVLYSGVCQSDLHTMKGTAATADGTPNKNINLPHIGGHEGVGRVVKVGEGCKQDVAIGQMVGIRFPSRICRRCEFCLAGKEQHCPKMINHLAHEDGSFQQYIALDADYLTILPDDIDPIVIGPVLCAGLTAYTAVLNCGVMAGQWLAVIGSGGGMGHLAVQYGRAVGARVIAIDGGEAKGKYAMGLGAAHYVDFKATQNVSEAVTQLTNGGVHAAICTAGSAKAYTTAADMLRVGGTLLCAGIPQGPAHFETPVATVVIKSLRIIGTLVGSLKQTLEAVDLVRSGQVKPTITVRPFRDLPKVYEELEKDSIVGRVVLKIAEDE